MAEYVETLLAPGETIVTDARQHWAALIRFARQPIIILGLAFLGLVIGLAIGDDGFFRGILDTLLGLATGALFVIAVVWLPAQALRWTSRRFVLTSRRVIRSDGLMRRTSLDASLDMITDISYRQTFIGARLGYADLRKIKQDIILVCLSGMGDTGPYREFVAYGQGQAAMSGFTRFTGLAGRPPKNAGFVLADPVAGAHGAYAVLAALRHKNKTGQGQFVDMSQWEATLQMVGDAVVGYQLSGKEPEAMGNRHPRMSPHGLFRCKDVEGEPGKMLDMWVTVAVADDAEWARLCSAMGVAELAADARFASLDARKANENELEAIVGAWTCLYSARAVTTNLQAIGIAAFPSSTHRDVFEDPNLNARGFFVDLTHPAHGRHRYPGIPWHMENAASGVDRAAPMLGQHTDEVMAEIGYSPGDIKRLREAGALK